MLKSLRHSSKKQNNFNKAFTIIELLIVIVIIAILVAIVTVSYNGITKQAKEASLKADADKARKSIMLYHAKNNTYPTAINCTSPTSTEVCIIPSPGNTLTYTMNNAINPAVFSLIVSNGAKKYVANELSSGAEFADIVTDGLVLNLDAGNKASYPGTGNTWYDLSGKGGNVALTNGPTYSTDNGGIINYDGINDYSDFYAPSLTTAATVEMWVRPTKFDASMFFGWNRYDVFANGNNNIGYNTGNSNVYGLASSTVTALGLLGNWKHYIFEMRSDTSFINNKIYVNSESQILSQVAGGAAVGSFNGGNGRIPGWRLDLRYLMPMSLGTFRVYNRALTQEEINQNFNALRGRYGI